MISKFNFNTQSILDELPIQEKTILESNMRQKKYLENQSIFTEGSIPAGIFLCNRRKSKKI